MKGMLKWSVCGAAMLLLAAGTVRAQSAPGAAVPATTAPKSVQAAPGAGSNATTPGKAAASTPGKPDAAEEAAFQSFYALSPQVPEQQIQQGEAFVMKYPQSRYNSVVYSRLTEAYYNTQQMDKMFAAADKSLALNPNEYTVMVLVGWVTPHTYDPNAPDAQQRLDKAEKYCKRGIELLQGLTKPANLTEQQFETARNATLSQGHSGLGLVYFREKRFGDAVAELQQAVKLAPQADATDYFVMGISLSQMKNYAEAAKVFDQCGAMTTALQKHCQQEADTMRKQAATAGAGPAGGASTGGGAAPTLKSAPGKP